MTGLSMKMLKRTAALLLCSAAVGFTAMAQDTPQGPPPGGRGGQRGGGGAQRIAMMQAQLNLTPDQTEKVKAIMADGRTQMMATRQDTTLSQEDKRAKTVKLMKSENEQIKAILNADQKVKFEAMEKEQREQMKERRENGGGTPPPPPAPPAPPAPPQN